MLKWWSDSVCLWVCGVVKWNKGREFYEKLKKLNEGKCFLSDNLNVFEFEMG